MHGIPVWLILIHCFIKTRDYCHWQLKRHVDRLICSAIRSINSFPAALVLIIGIHRK